jgi:hypothetical protein
MSLQTSGIRDALAHQFNAASGYAGGCTRHQREDAHYERGRKDGLGQALELVDTFLRAEHGEPGGTRADAADARGASEPRGHGVIT